MSSHELSSAHALSMKKVVSSLGLCYLHTHKRTPSSSLSNDFPCVLQASAGLQLRNLLTVNASDHANNFTEAIQVMLIQSKLATALLFHSPLKSFSGVYVIAHEIMCHKECGHSRHERGSLNALPVVDSLHLDMPCDAKNAQYYQVLGDLVASCRVLL